MSTRDEVFADVEATGRARREEACRVIGDAPTVSEARSELKRAVRTLPGVADDPGTVEDILRYADIYAARTSGTGLSIPEASERGSDKCWINGVHRCHTWTSAGQRHLCAGQPVSD